MKTSIVIRELAIVLATIHLTVHAQPAGFAVTERGADYKVLQKTTVVQGTNRVHKYTELATGMNYTNNTGQWVESCEQISILPQGGAVAVQGRHKVYFPADIYNGVIVVITPDGRELRSRPVGVSYDDGSQTAWIAQLKHSIGWLTSSNQVVYRDAFTDFKADLVCTYRRGGFESDLVFREQPPTPDQYGLDNSSSTIELVTEFFNTPEPGKIPGQYDEWLGLQDNTLKFGSMRMGAGKAFAVNLPDPQNQKTNSVLPKNNAPVHVYKSWLHLQGRTFLV